VDGDGPAAFVGGEKRLLVHDGETVAGGTRLLGPGLVLGQVGHQRAGVGGRREDVHEGEAGPQLFIRANADQAAHQVDDQARVALLERAQGIQPAVSLVLGRLAHHAGVEHDHVGLVGLAGRRIAEAFQGRPDALGIGHVHLAAFGPNVVFHRGEIIPSMSAIGRCGIHYCQN
jgi:hypothetical protein